MTDQTENPIQFVKFPERKSLIWDSTYPPGGARNGGTAGQDGGVSALTPAITLHGGTDWSNDISLYQWKKKCYSASVATLWERIRALVRAGKVRISSHGYDGLVEDDIMVRDVIMGIDHGQLIEA